MANPFVPSVEIYQQFALATNARLEELSAFLLGGLAHVARYDKVAEKPRILAGSYVTKAEGEPSSFVSYAYPNKPTGTLVDTEFTKVNIDNAFLEYYADEVATNWRRTGAAEITHVSVNFADNGSFLKSAALGDRGARIGDRVWVTGELADTTPFSLATYIKDIRGVLSASSTGNVTAGSANAIAGSDSANVTYGALNQSDATAVGNPTNYSGLASGRRTETYVIEVIQGSTGGNITTARLSVTSASGTDNVPLVTPAAYDSPTSIGTRGLTVTFASLTDDDLYVGDKFTVVVNQEYTLPVLTKGGTYNASDFRDRTYIIEVIKGGTIASNPVVRVSTVEGTDAGGEITLTAASANTSQTFAVGSYGVTMSIAATEGLFKGDRWTLTATASKETNLRRLVLGHVLPQGVAFNEVSADIKVKLFIVDDISLSKRGVVPGDYNFESTLDEVRIYDTISIPYAGWTVNGAVAPLPLHSPEGFSNRSQVYISYRAWYPRSTNVLSVRSSGDLATLPGPTDVDNPLKYALSKALLTSNSHPVFYFNTGNPSVVDNWAAGLAFAEAFESTYGVVPLTRDNAVLDLVAAHVNTLSGPQFNRYRVAWLTDSPRDEAIIVGATTSDNGEVVTATITDNTEQSGTQYTLLTITSGNASFADLGVRPLDRVRFGFSTNAWGDEFYNEYVVERVINDNSLVLASGPDVAEIIPRKVEIQRTLTAAEKVQSFTGKLATLVDNTVVVGSTTTNRYPGMLVRFLPFATVMDGVNEVPSYFMAATLAGIRSALAPHQSMTRIQVPGFSAVKGIEEFTISQLNELAAAGGFIVSPDYSTGALTVRHAVTAGPFDDVNQREESVISNVHSISFYFFDILNPYIGQSNVTPSNLATIRAELEAAADFLRSANFSQRLGGQLTDFTLNSVRQSPVSKDSILVQADLTLPGPTNRIRLDLLII